MKKDKEIDQFIRESLDIEKAPLDFSKHVMGQIYATEKEKEKALGSLIQKHILEEPSVNFTVKVLSGIKADSKANVYQPVIGKKVWSLIASFFIILVLYVFFYLNSPSKQSDIIDAYLLKIESIFSFNFPTIFYSPLFALSMFALSSLLFLDYLIRNRSVSS